MVSFAISAHVQTASFRAKHSNLHSHLRCPAWTFSIFFQCLKIWARCIFLNFATFAAPVVIHRAFCGADAISVDAINPTLAFKLSGALVAQIGCLNEVTFPRPRFRRFPHFLFHSAPLQSPISRDYADHLPPRLSRKKIFILIDFGLCLFHKLLHFRQIPA